MSEWEHDRVSDAELWAEEPLDPDIDGDAAATGPAYGPVMAVVAVGGVIGTCARYGATQIWPHASGFDWTTFTINVTGCLLIGVLMVLVTERFTVHPLVRPFLGTGILGGYTTFSTAMVGTHSLADAGSWGTAAAYLLGTLIAAVAAVWTGVALARRLSGRAPEGAEPR